MTRSLRGKTLESVLPVLDVEVMAYLALVRVRVLLILTAKDTLDALANEIHDGQEFEVLLLSLDKIETTLAKKADSDKHKYKKAKSLATSCL